MGKKRVTEQYVLSIFVQKKLAAFTRPNVNLVQDPIERFNEKGIVTQSGKVHESDVIILATGYDMQHCLFPIYGKRQDKHIGEIWDDEPRCYLGMTSPGKVYKMTQGNM